MYSTPVHSLKQDEMQLPALARQANHLLLLADAGIRTGKDLLFFCLAAGLAAQGAVLPHVLHLRTSSHPKACFARIAAPRLALMGPLDRPSLLLGWQGGVRGLLALVPHTWGSSPNGAAPPI
jgi:hypothetical protein